MSDAKIVPVQLAARQSAGRSSGPEQHLCPRCKAGLDLGAKYCPHCGLCLQAGPPVQPPADAVPIPLAPPAAPTEQPEQPEMPQEGVVPPAPQPVPAQPPCQCSCGRDLPHDARYCCYCGASVRPGKPLCRLSGMGKDAGLTTDMTGQELTIGKAPDSDLAIPQDEYVSRRHARLVASDGMIFLEDAGSANGTYLRVRRPLALESGDEILVGTTVFRFEQA